MEKNKLSILTFLCITLFVVVFISLVSAQDTGSGGGTAPTPTNGSGEGGGVIGINTSISFYPNYQEIMGTFNNQTWLPVIVRLVDNSNITITGTEEERRTLLIQQDEWFKLAGDEFYASLPKEDFKGERGSIRMAFVGFINKKGFETLLNDSRVNSISWTKYDVHTTLENASVSENVSEVEKEIESKIINNVSKSDIIKETKEENLLWLWIITIPLVLIILILYLIMKLKKR